MMRARRVIADRPRLHRPADVRAAPTVALVLTACAVIGTWPAVAQCPAAPQMRVELVQDVHLVLQLAQLDVPQRGTDRALDEPLVHVPRAYGQVDNG